MDRVEIGKTALAVPIALGMPMSAWAQASSPNYGSHMWDGGWHGWFFGPIMMIIFFAVAVAIVVLLVRWLTGGAQNKVPPSSHGKSPVDILKERFARGEIDKEEFEERRQVLDG